MKGNLGHDRVAVFIEARKPIIRFHRLLRSFNRIGCLDYSAISKNLTYFC